MRKEGRKEFTLCSSVSSVVEEIEAFRERHAVAHSMTLREFQSPWSGIAFLIVHLTLLLLLLAFAFDGDDLPDALESAS